MDSFKRYIRQLSLKKGMFEFLKRKKDVAPVEKYEKAQVTRVYNKLKNQRLELLREEMEDLQRKAEERHLEMKIERLRQDLYEDEDEEEEINPLEGGLNPDMLIMSMLTKVLNKPSASVTAPAPQPELPQQTGLSDEQLREIKQKIPPQHLKTLKKMPEDEVIDFIKQKYPSLDDMTIARALIILKE